MRPIFSHTGAVLAGTLCLLSLASCTAKRKYTDISTHLQTAVPSPCAQCEKPDLSSVRRSYSFVACGDNIIYGGNTKEARANAQPGGREYNFKPMYKNIADFIAAADVSFINQETVMAGGDHPISYYPCFNSPQDLGYDLEELGYDIVNIANNHMLDAGTDGLEDTIAFWKQRDVLLLGGYDNEEDYDRVRVLDCGGIRTAFLSYTYATNGIKKWDGYDVVVPYLDDEDILRQLAIARSSAEVVMVSVHWGDEGAFKPNDEQKRLAKLMADGGADVIIGHHPHVLEPVEWIEGKDGHRTLCVYSLGNFIGEQAYDYNTVGGMISFDVTLFGSTEPSFENIVFHPTVCHYSSDFYINEIYFMEDYSDYLASQHAVRRYYAHAYDFDTLIGYVTKTIDKSFLPAWFADK